MSRSRRLVDIVRVLKAAAPGAVTAEALAARFTVSDRTIYRDMATLMESGLPIEGEAGLGYVLSVEGGPPPIVLTWDEAETLWRGASLLSLTANQKLAQSAESAHARLEAALGPERTARLRGSPILPNTVTPLNPAVLEALQKAVAGQRMLRVAHVDPEGGEQVTEGRAVALTRAGGATVLRIEDTQGAAQDVRAERIVKVTVRAG